MTKYTEAQKRAILKYQGSKATIKITIEVKQKEKYQAYAKEKNISLTQLICLAIENYIKSEQ